MAGLVTLFCDHINDCEPLLVAARLSQKCVVSLLETMAIAGRHLLFKLLSKKVCNNSRHNYCCPNFVVFSPQNKKAAAKIMMMSCFVKSHYRPFGRRAPRSICNYHQEWQNNLRIHGGHFSLKLSHAQL
jgi:hypothetical protein